MPVHAGRQALLDSRLTVSVAEAAAILRVSRSAAYTLVDRYEATGGAEGLAAVRIGGRLRVPTSVLRELAEGSRA